MLLLSDIIGFCPSQPHCNLYNTSQAVTHLSNQDTELCLMLKCSSFFFLLLFFKTSSEIFLPKLDSLLYFESEVSRMRNVFVTPTLGGPVIRGEEGRAWIAWLSRTQLSGGVDRPLCCSSAVKTVNKSTHAHTHTHTYTSHTHKDGCRVWADTLHI